jgi:hypothetical protein
MFELSVEHLDRLCAMNQFEIPADEIVLFGLRGSLPVNPDDHEYRQLHHVDLVDIDHTHPRCVLGQWKPNEGLALFPGSTVPHRRYVEKSIAKNGEGANQLMTGCHAGYRKGIHKAGKPTAHQAFRQANKLPIRRTGDDLEFDVEDRVEFMRPFDNLHAAWCMGVDHDTYASAGCQVVVGYPRCARRNDGPDVGPWKTFKERAYDVTQDSFHYILLKGRDAFRVAASPEGALSARLRFGSKGDLVSELQKQLAKDGHYEGEPDGDFGPRTLFAVLEYQTAAFGSEADDGIVGTVTASALGMTLPAA